MNTGPAVIVKKMGFFTALVRGVFGTIMVLLLCLTALGLYGMRIAARFVEALPDWQAALPPVVASALTERPALDYESALKIAAQVERTGDRDGEGIVRVEVTNAGPEIVSLLSLRAIVEDDSREAVCELPFNVATPYALGDEWRGPLLPGKTRVLARQVQRIIGEPQVSYEVNQLQVWRGERAGDARSGGEPAVAAAPALPPGPERAVPALNTESAAPARESGAD